MQKSEDAPDDDPGAGLAELQARLLYLAGDVRTLAVRFPAQAESLIALGDGVGDAAVFVSGGHPRPRGLPGDLDVPFVPAEPNVVQLFP